jgi:hypothetical protein
VEWERSANPSLAITPVYYDDGARLGKYYIDINGSTEGTLTADENGRLSKPWHPQKAEYAQGKFAFAGTVSIDGLRDYSRYIETGDVRFLAHAKAAADWLVDKQPENGAWPYSIEFEGMTPPWISGMDQGLAISLLARVYQETGDERYLAAAKKAYRALETPVENGGTVDRFDDGTEVLEEYPGNREINRHVLNGAIFATLGVLDLARITDDEQLRARWVTLATNIANNLDAFDSGDWSIYSDPRAAPKRYLASEGYHRLHIAQLRLMNMATGDPRWGQYAQWWYQYLEDKVVAPPVQ